MSRPVLQLAFFTAQADPRTCALSPVQTAFLRRCSSGPEVARVDRNFPYAASPAPWRHRPLWRESLSVARQFLEARRPAFAARHRAAVQALLARADETLFLAGSCGLELLGAVQLSPDDLARLSFVAYGAVARARPACPGIVVLGDRDWIARGRGPAPDRWVGCGHLDYLTNDAFLAITRDFVARRLDAATPHHATAL